MEYAHCINCTIKQIDSCEEHNGARPAAKARRLGNLAVLYNGKWRSGGE
jgi:hypothetical protein